jgi:hypothetical protein
METYRDMVYLDITDMPALRGKVERAIRKIYELPIRGHIWLLAKSVKDSLTIVTVGKLTVIVGFDERSEQFIAREIVPYVKHD